MNSVVSGQEIVLYGTISPNNSVIKVYKNLSLEKKLKTEKSFSFYLEPNNEYILEFSCDEYASKKVYFSTFLKESNKIKYGYEFPIYIQLSQDSTKSNPTHIAYDSLRHTFSLVKENKPVTNHIYFYNSGSVWLNEKQYARAKYAFTESVKIDSTNANSYLNLAICQYNTLDTTNACKSLKKAIELESKAAEQYLSSFCK